MAIRRTPPALAIIPTVALSCVAGCGGKAVENANPDAAGGASAGLEMIISVDSLSAPGDFDDIGLEVSQQSSTGGWNKVSDRHYGVPSLPMILPLVAGRGAGEVLVTVTAYKGAGHPVVQRVAQVRVPTDRLAALPLVLAKSCVGQVGVGAAGEPISTCPGGQSCQPSTGACGSNIVDSNTLPTYVPGQTIETGVPSVGDAAPPPDGGPDSSLMAEAAANEPIVNGNGMVCTPSAHEAVGTKITLTVNWPQTLANAGCLQSTGCTGDINIWLLASYDIAGNAVTGSTVTCANVTPPTPLSALGSQSEGLPAGQTSSTQITFNPATWAAVAANKAGAATTGTLGGWNVGSSLTIDPTLSLNGLKPSSPLNNPMAVWPASESSIPQTDLADDDNDGNPGVTALPSSAMGNSLPATALQTMPPFAPQADQLYLALRTELSLYGTSTSCTDMAGTARALLLNSHVVGCHVRGMSACNMTQWDFIDANSTVYVGPGVRIPAGTPAPSFAPPQITGTFRSKVLSTDGSPVDCAAVLAALP